MRTLAFPLVVLAACASGVGRPSPANAAAAEEQPVELTQSESAPRPAPAWVRMVDLGEQDPALAGYRAPAGVKVEVVASEPNVVNPVAMRFAEDGTLLLIEWRVGSRVEGFDTTITYRDGTVQPVHQWVKDAPDELKALTDSDGDGTFDRVRVVMNDLQLPSSVLAHDGWHYFTTRGGVTRRRQSKIGPDNPFDVSERIVQGLAGFNQHQASGLTLSPDGWLFVTSGDDDDHPEGSDGTRLDLLRTGGVWQMRPDGSQLSLFARGFRNPYRDVALDAFGNMFHMDNDQEDGSKFQGCRLIHIMEEADYGWRLKPSVRCCWPDHDRGAVWGERPGTMPSMLKTGRGAPCGVLVYEGAGFPADFFRGLIVYPDVFQRNVRAYKVERNGSTFKVVEQFTLLETDDPMFRPCQALQGPDGAIYLCDWRTNSAGPAAAWGDGQHGGVWRLTWQGAEHLPDAPAIPRGAMDAWAKVRQARRSELWRLLDSPDYEVRTRAAEELRHSIEVGTRRELIEAAKDAARPPEARAAALRATAPAGGGGEADDRWWWAAVVGMLADEHVELARLAAELIGRHVTRAGKGGLDVSLARPAREGHPAVRRAAALAMARVLSLREDGLAELDRRGFASSLLRALRTDEAVASDRFLRDGLLRALERLGEDGLGPLGDMAADGDDEAKRAFAVSLLECLRTREGAAVLDRVLREAKDLTGEQTARLLTAYRYIQVEPGIDPEPVARWLEEHPSAPAEQQVAALRSLALMGEMNAERVLPAILRLLNHDSADTRLAAIKVVGEQRLIAAARPLFEAMNDTNRGLDERRAVVAALANLRGQQRFAQITFDPGTDALADDLAAFAADAGGADAMPLRGDVLNLLAQIDFAKAQPIAQALLDSGDAAGAAVAIGVLAADVNAAVDIARRFVDGKLPQELLSQVAGALQRHMPTDGSAPTAELAELRGQVLKRGLSLAGGEEGVKRVEELVRTKGDADRGREVFLNAAKSTCATCHRLEGAGGQIGPDLTGLHQTASIGKLVESILEPSKEIKEGFEQYRVRTKSGQTYTGYKVSSDPAQTVLRDAQGNDVVIAADDIEQLAASDLSLMPEGSYALLSLDELVDLVAFLADGKAQEALRAGEGVPNSE